jgi:phosphonoacetaldehyde hydrolase
MEAVAQHWAEAHGRQPNEADVDQLYDRFIPLQLEVLPHYADLIPGTLDAVAEFCRRGLKIGANTGYNREMVNILQRGFVPDSTICAGDVPAGRPEPWMALLNAMELRVFPMEALVKIDDTLPGIAEGLNAGMWTIGLAKTGNEIGLSEAEITTLAPELLQKKLDWAYQRMV